MKHKKGSYSKMGGGKNKKEWEKEIRNGGEGK